MLAFALRHPSAMPLLDAGLALRRPDSAFRRRLLIMAAILEAQPQFSDKFLTEDQRFALVPLTLYAARAVARAAAGIILLAWLHAA